MKIVFMQSSSTSYSFIDYNESEVDSSVPSNCSLYLFGRALVTRNIELLDSLYGLETVIVPKKLNSIANIVKSTTNIPVEEIDDNTYGRLIKSDLRISHKIQVPERNDFTNTTPYTQQNSIILNKNTLFLPCNTVIGKRSNRKSIQYYRFQYPWEFLEIMQELLKNEVTHSIISNKATIAKSAVIEGPCIIEDNVVIDDFAKIKGPAYIGNGSFIGMGSLIRNSMLDYNTNIGYNCEIGKTYFAGNAKISHHNVILDSMIGKNVWFGGYSGTANVLLTRKNVQYRINGELVDTGRNHFGAVVSNNSSIGASVIILPGRKIPPDSIVPAGTIFSK
jgi:UDP-N-acetylglucosamine diphosphorylase / glucose-1-phosphate thymidylyltransferase / UDP-N-acetylgalactosamine diphosphorylase / glucosamine-1-phosphate N-acetyltransferase / galactosamine-1-phosphate N-acetyltransferase